MATDDLKSGGELLVEALRVHGADHVFCVPGESYLAVLDALVDAPEIQVTACRQEGGAAIMAEAAGKLTGQKRDAGKATGNFANARNMFQAQTTQGQSAATAAADKSDSVHGNLVCGMQLFGSTFGDAAAEFTTSALDGKVVFWTRDEISAAMSALAIS